MTTSRLTSGACVACGRRAGRRERRCAYCGEQVWRPAWWRATRLGVLLVPPLAVAALTALTTPGWISAAARRLVSQPVCAFLFAAGTGLLLLPVADDDLPASSTAELKRRHIGALLGGWAMGLYAVAGAAALAASPAHRLRAGLLAALLALSTAAMPVFMRIPWRSLLAAALLAAALAGTGKGDPLYDAPSPNLLFTFVSTATNMPRTATLTYLDTVHSLSETAPSSLCFTGALASACLTDSFSF